MADLDVPLGGVKDDPDESWAAIRDGFNSWVSISSDNTCKVYGVVNGEDPAWGITGNNEEVTRHIMCCEDPTTAGSAPQSPEVWYCIYLSTNEEYEHFI